MKLREMIRQGKRNKRLPIKRACPVGEILDHWARGWAWRVAVLGAVDVDSAQTAVVAVLLGRPEEPIAWWSIPGDGFEIRRPVTALEVVLAAGGVEALGALVESALREGRSQLLPADRLPIIEGAGDYREEWLTAQATDEWQKEWPEWSGHPTLEETLEGWDEWVQKWWGK